jgi:hypothetical protein
VLRAAELDPDEDGRAAVELRVGALRVAGLRVEALRVAGLRAGALLVVDRAVLLAVVVRRDDVPRATCCTCLLRLSRRFNTLSTSACFARLRTCACSWSIADLSVF